jgi:hypothetical protein
MLLFVDLIQILIYLFLAYNQMGVHAAQALGEFLKTNMVKEEHRYGHISHRSLSCFLQTLTHLFLSMNEIGDAGAQHLAEALQKNTVTINRSLLGLLSASLP